MWYGENRRFDGKNYPFTTPDKNFVLRGVNVRQLTAEEEQMSLDELFAKFNPPAEEVQDGKIHGNDDDSAPASDQGAEGQD